jgi:WD40 repeat protein
MTLSYSSCKTSMKHTKEIKDIMKHSIKLFLTTILCIASTVSIAMELELSQKKNCKPAKILTEITCIKESGKAFYLTENNILIEGDRQINIVDLTTNEKNKTIFSCTPWSAHIIVHPNRTKFAVVAYHYPLYTPDLIQTIIVYNAKTYDIEHTIKWKNIIGDNSISSLYFNPLDDNFAVCIPGKEKVVLYNYKTNKFTFINVPEAAQEHQQLYAPIFSFHPTQTQACLGWKTLYTHDLKTCTNKKIAQLNNDYKFCKHAPDGTSMAIGTNWKIYAKKSDQEPYLIVRHEKPTSWDRNNPYTTFCAIAIHPNSKVLMTASETNNRTSESYYILEYWDINTGEHIAARDLFLETKGCGIQICFSPSGTKLLITTIPKCFEVAVPFKAIYQNSTKKTLPYLLFFLKHYAHDDGIAIPQELTQLLATTVLEAHKR